MKISAVLYKPYMAILLTLVVSILCFMPSEQLQGNTPDDKISHLLAFGALAFFWYFYSKNFTKTFFVLAIYAVVIEVIQKNLPPSFHRGFEWLDMVADIVGIIIGFLVVLLYNYLQKKWPSFFN